MSMIDKFIDVVKAQKTTFKAVDLNIVLDHNEQIDAAIQALMAYFGEDDKREAVRVTLAGSEIGYIVRVDLYEFIEQSMKSIGSGDHSIIPGQGTYKILELCCPKPGCKKRLKIILFDERFPPKCPDHQSVSMEICE